MGDRREEPLVFLHTFSLGFVMVEAIRGARRHYQTYVYVVFLKATPGLAGTRTVAVIRRELLDKVDEEEGVHELERGCEGGLRD